MSQLTNTIIDIGITRSHLTATQLYLVEVNKVMNVKGHYEECKTCDGLGEIMTEHDCRGYGYPPTGCPLCDGLGYTAKKCPVCDGDKEVWVDEN